MRAPPKQIRHVDIFAPALHIKAGGNGYIQASDYDRLMALGTEGTCYAVLHLKAGDFATAATVLMTVQGPTPIEETSALRQRFLEACILGPQRTPERALQEDEDQQELSDRYAHVLSVADRLP